MAKELIELGKSRRPIKDSQKIPQLAFDGRAISLKKLNTDPQSIFDRVQYRICELPYSKKKVPSYCNTTYPHEVEAVVGGWRVEENDDYSLSVYAYDLD